MAKQETSTLELAEEARGLAADVLQSVDLLCAHLTAFKAEMERLMDPDYVLIEDDKNVIENAIRYEKSAVELKENVDAQKKRVEYLSSLILSASKAVRKTIRRSQLFIGCSFLIGVFGAFAERYLPFVPQYQWVGEIILLASLTPVLTFFLFYLFRKEKRLVAAVKKLEKVTRETEIIVDKLHEISELIIECKMMARKIDEKF